MTVNCISADDMGLGKTLTMISLVLSAKERDADTDDDIENDEWCGKNGKRKRPVLAIGDCIVSILNFTFSNPRRHSSGVSRFSAQPMVRRDQKAL